MGEVLPFPRVRDRPFIHRHATAFADMPPVKAERYLARQLKVQADTMARRGIAPEHIAKQVQAMECGIRIESAMVCTSEWMP